MSEYDTAPGSPTAEEIAIEAAQKRYLAALHGMQTGVAYTMQGDPKDTEPKHLRVGVNSALVQQSALTKLLVDKGLITWLEYWEALATAMEHERDRYQDELRQRFGHVGITLR